MNLDLVAKVQQRRVHRYFGKRSLIVDAVTILHPDDNFSLLGFWKGIDPAVYKLTIYFHLRPRARIIK
ncbi:hypothetical protein [Rhodoplanes sp. Z2-YC6860]|uniref:hypothetical protein n=1 Tax=Rhodoplanes sp. Z2-YC6860 TaxID=674703 RepID=UPI0012EDF262|nr:hypothetical protein [Rhodoplanes sp. Z2-YC6860]